MGIFKDQWTQNLLKSRGLGDTVKKVTNAVGIPACNQCEERRKKLNRMFPYNKTQGLQGAREKTLVVTFKTDEMMYERIYERDLKLKFKDRFSHTKKVKPSVSGVRAAFEIHFKGEVKDLVEVAKYIEQLDRKNKIYDSKVFK